MKRTSLFLLLAVTCIVNHAQTITKEFLTKGEFNLTEEPIYSFSLNFNSAGGYTLYFGVEGEPWMDSGKYQIKNNRVYLHCIKSDSAFQHVIHSEYDFTAGNCIATLTRLENDLYNTEFLELTCLTPKKNLIGFSSDNYTASFPVPGSEVPVGSKRKVKEFEIITTGLKKTITTDNVKIRDKPSKSGKAFKFLTDWYGGDELPSVPKGTEVILIGHTPVKEKIDKYEDYWYYVNVGAANGVWMYGAFIKFD